MVNALMKIRALLLPSDSQQAVHPSSVVSSYIFRYFIFSVRLTSSLSTKSARCRKYTVDSYSFHSEHNNRLQYHRWLWWVSFSLASFETVLKFFLWDLYHILFGIVLTFSLWLKCGWHRLWNLSCQFENQWIQFCVHKKGKRLLLVVQCHSKKLNRHWSLAL